MVLGCILLHLFDGFPNSVVTLATLWLLCCIFNARNRHFRFGLLLLTTAIMLGPAFSGVLCLVGCPSVCVLLIAGLCMVRVFAFRLTSIIHVAQVGSESNTQSATQASVVDCREPREEPEGRPGGTGDLKTARGGPP